MADKEPEDTLAYKVTAGVLALGAGWLAQKLVTSLWQKSTGKNAPHDIDDDDATVAGVVVFAAVSAGVAALTKILASKGTKKIAVRVSAAESARRAQSQQS